MCYVLFVIFILYNSTTMSEIRDITKALVDFRDEREWKQFHDSKNLATALSIEVAELNELFLWKTIRESEEVDLERLKEELADVFAYAFITPCSSVVH
jgi:NTP pyrophosphatase (non-canonical NTP hydrolase)